ncbi:hypothetical protein O181_075648 [Austropuccinia psidii MF-1]|uniref:Retrovirus-related Pol polyprotein from transposon TNT 1-94-like beta-barrel domain-containing protein n=1 Tax=Austropuccinia psidii MF-1 TaxID=1389203 RepID=A0A9Q3FDF1_9BASI|nr:hypothetical protein [Austropuccinia psidii MF-1]
MTCMCAFNLLRTIPSSLAFVKNNLYTELKLSKKVPTIKSVLSEVKLSLSRDQEVPAPDALALDIEKPVRYKNGEHSPNASHTSKQCFQLHPHLLKEFQECKNHEKLLAGKKEEENKNDNTCHHPRVYYIQDPSGRVNIIREDHAILESGASHTLLKKSERFVSFTETCAALQQSDGTMIYAKGFGKAAVTAADRSIVHMKNSLIVPSITTPLISLSPFLQKGCSLSGKGSKIQLRNENGFAILEGRHPSNNLIPSTSSNPPEEVNQAVPIQHELSSPLAFNLASEAESNQDKSSPESPSIPSREIKKSNNTHLHKGWVMDTVPEKAPGDITSNLDSSNIIYEKEQQFTKSAALFNSNTPRTYLEAISSSSSEDWKRAIDKKIACIEENKVWLPVPIPNGSTWVLHLKKKNLV